jgi:hypothetical protein
VDKFAGMGTEEACGGGGMIHSFQIMSTEPDAAMCVMEHPDRPGVVLYKPANGVFRFDWDKEQHPCAFLRVRHVRQDNELCQVEAFLTFIETLHKQMHPEVWPDVRHVVTVASHVLR